MRYDDPDRPQYEAGGTTYPLHASGAPIPSITLVRPMQSQIPLTNQNGEEVAHEWVWGWLCCIHAARGRNSFSHFYGWIGDLGLFQDQFLEDPEGTLQRYFKWKGMEKEELVASNQQIVEDDIFAN